MAESTHSLTFTVDRVVKRYRSWDRGEPDRVWPVLDLPVAARHPVCELAGWGFRRAGVPDPVLAASVTWLARYRHPRCGGSPDLARFLLEVFAEPCDGRAWKRRTLALIKSNPRQVTESSAQALFQAAAYPETIAAAACARETSGRGEKGNKRTSRHEGGLGKKDLPYAI